LVTLRRKEDKRVRIERDGDYRPIPAGKLASCGHDGRVSAVNAVEVADGRHSAANRFRRGLVKPERNDGHATPERVQGIRCPSL